MLFPEHRASYELGDRLLNPEERIVVTTRPGPKEPQRIADHLGVSEEQPERLIKHVHHSDGEYTPSFLTKKSLDDCEFFRYVDNYKDGEQTVYGRGLKGRVVYLVHTYSNQLDPQALNKMNEEIAFTAKYNGAEAVVLIAYTFNYSAQERGVHDSDHERMQDGAAKLKFDGQAPIGGLQLMQYAMSGVDAIITPHNHSPLDLERMCGEVNDKLSPLRREGSNWRYNINFFEVDLAPMTGVFVSDFGKKHLEFDLSDGGRNVLFMAPDTGAEAFARRVRQYSGLENSALAVMNKKKADDNSSIELLELIHSEGLSDEEGIGGKYIFLVDDCIRSGMTMQRNIQALSGMEMGGIKRDPRIKGRPASVAVYTTRTNFGGASTKILSIPTIDHIIITNADARGYKNTGEIDTKTLMVWINGMMAEAAKAVERGDDPKSVLTPDYIRDHELLNVRVPHGHKKRRDRGII